MEDQAKPNLATGQLYRVAWILYLAMAVAGATWIGLREREIPFSLFVDPETWLEDLGLGAAAAAILLAFWEIARRTLKLARELEERLTGMLSGLDPGEALALAVLSGFAEELFFRGAVQGSWGWLWASVLFAVLHAGRGAAFRLWSLFALAAGMILGGLVEWRGSLLGPIVAHVLINAVNLRRLALRGPAEG